MKKNIIVFMLLISTISLQSMSKALSTPSTYKNFIISKAALGLRALKTVATSTKTYSVHNPIKASLGVVIAGYACAELYNWKAGNDLVTTKLGKKIGAILKTSTLWFAGKYDVWTLEVASLKQYISTLEAKIEDIRKTTNRTAEKTEKISFIEKKAEQWYIKESQEMITQCTKDCYVEHKLALFALKQELDLTNWKFADLQKKHTALNITVDKLIRELRSQLGTTI